MALFDLKVINSVLAEMEETRGIPREKIITAIEMALAAAYKKEYGKKGQIIRAKFNPETGDLEFNQIKIVVDDTLVRPEDEEAKEGDDRTRFNPEHHIMLETARMIKKDAQVDDELEFPLESKEDFGRIASQTAKQVVMQRIREAEKVSVLEEFGERVGEIVTGHVQRFERGNLYIDLGRAVAVLPYEEQIKGERYRQGERIRALLYHVDESPRGTFLKLTRASGEFLVKLFAEEAPELANGTVEVKAVAREAGSRAKIAVYSDDPQIDPVGALVGGRGVRVSTVTSELGGEKIDIIEWVDDEIEFIERALSPAEIMHIEVDEEEDKHVIVEVSEDQQSLAIGRGGQNVRLAAKLTGWKIDIYSNAPEKPAEDEEEVEETPEETHQEEHAEEEAVAENEATEEVSTDEGGAEEVSEQHTPESESQEQSEETESVE